jgi:transcriptional regulator with XRE-family HTH domain
MTEAESAPTLVIRSGGKTHVVGAEQPSVVIGRGDKAEVPLQDPRISRAHVRVERRTDEWVAVDNSLNGMYVDGQRRSSVVVRDGLTIHVGSPEGPAVAFALSDPTELTRPSPGVRVATSTAPHTVEWSQHGVHADQEDTGEVWTSDVADTGIARAGAAAAARRRELDITQRTLARYKIINAGALIQFEKGRSWPRERTRTKIEEVLQWPAGTLEQIRNGGAVPGEAAATVHDTEHTSLILSAVDVAMKTFATAIDALPADDEAGFAERAAVILSDMRELEGVVARAARGSRGTAELARALSAVRKRYDELTFRAAAAPGATLGQRLYRARRGANLSGLEAAAAAGLSQQLIDAVEAEQPINPQDAAKVETLISELG